MSDKNDNTRASLLIHPLGLCRTTELAMRTTTLVGILFLATMPLSGEQAPGRPSGKTAERLAITEVPFQREVVLRPDEAVLLVLPDRKEVALWCRPPGASPVEKLLQTQDLVLDYGEKPFQKPDFHLRRLDGGEGATPTSSSYIRLGGVTTWSGGPGHERDLYVGKYRLTLREEGPRKRSLPLKVSVRLATEAELEDVLEGPPLREYALTRLKAKDPSARARAVELLLKYVRNEGLVGSALRKGVHPTALTIREAIRPLAKDADPKVHSVAQGCLRLLGDEPAILAYLTPSPPENARTVHGGFELANWCRSGGGEKAARRVLAYLDTKDDDLVLFALGFFANYEYNPARPKLLGLLKHPSARVRLGAAVELRADDEAGKGIPGVLAELMKDPDRQIGLEALREANRWADRLLDNILPFLKDKEEDARMAAVYALSGCHSPRAFEPLSQATHDPSPRVRAEAAVRLGRMGGDKAFARLAELLAEPSPEVRAQAANGLRWVNSARALPILRERLKGEKDKRVRAEIESTIRSLEP